MRNLWQKFKRYPVGRTVQIESSAIQSAAYYPRQARLDVRFQSGSLYQYGCVDAEVWHNFLDAESKGRYFQKQVRDRYPFLRIDN